MRHSFISWDCSFRNFHHLIDALECQNYDLNEVELIYVEQRTRKQADAYNHAMGLPSLYDRHQTGSHSFLKPLYLNDPNDQAYHLGRILNVGIEAARGEIITIMDGDMLLPPDFLIELDMLHQGKSAVVNVERKMCPRPIGASIKNWYKGQFNYQRCLEICQQPQLIPTHVTNKGPMISASLAAFKMVGGYDEHAMFSTGLSRAGQDLNTRLEIATGSKSQVIKRVAVHPFHPHGFSRKTLDAVRILQVQASIITWSRKHGVMNWCHRKNHLESVYRRYQKLFSRVHRNDYSGLPLTPLFKSSTIGFLYKGFIQLVRPFKP